MPPAVAMQKLWVITVFWSLASAAPDAGYSYTAPRNSHSFGGQSHFVGGQPHSFGGSSFASSGSFLSSGAYSPSFADNSLSVGGHSQSFGGYFYPAPAPGLQYGPPPTTTPTPTASVMGLTGGPSTQAPTRIMKSIYAFTAGKETGQPPKPAAGLPSPPRKVHYKIVFIKAPSLQAQAQQVAQSQARAEHKTLIYVLVKKPEEAAAASVPAPAPTAPSRPEVYFIRYKARAQAVGHDHAHGPDAAYGVPARAGGPY